MSYPATFSPFDWSNLPSEASAFDKENAQEAEKRLAEFVEKYEVHWRYPVKEENKLPVIEVAKGDIFLVENTKEFVLYNGSEYVKLNAFVPFWKAPVTEENKLPTGGNTIGDVRLVKATNQFYICFATSGSIAEQWKLFESAPHHWMPPVANEANLPTTLNVLGDVRFVEELKQFFFCIKITGSIAEQWGPFGHAPTTETLTWSIGEKLLEGTVPGGFRRLATGEIATLYEIEFELTKGTAELELKVNGTAVEFEGAVTKVKVKEAVEALAVKTPLELTSKAKIELIVTKVGSIPEGFALSAFVSHISKVA